MNLQLIFFQKIAEGKILAKKFGATDFVNPKEIPGNQAVPEYLIDKFDGGFDYTFGRNLSFKLKKGMDGVKFPNFCLECCGNVSTMVNFSFLIFSKQL